YFLQNQQTSPPDQTPPAIPKSGEARLWHQETEVQWSPGAQPRLKKRNPRTRARIARRTASLTASPPPESSSEANLNRNLWNSNQPITATSNPATKSNPISSTIWSPPAGASAAPPSSFRSARYWTI